MRKSGSSKNDAWCLLERILAEHLNDKERSPTFVLISIIL